MTQARVKIEPAKLQLLQRNTAKYRKTTRKYLKKIQEEAKLNVADFLAGAGKTSETKTKQKHFPKQCKSRAQQIN